jgi:phospholipid/cholesterol/gamma-HCH transport system substrate-binding protein
METRARFALIGLFTIAVVLAGFAFVYWIQNTGGIGQRTAYRVRFEGSVSGLLVGSSVLFNGMRVGEVASLELDPKEPRIVMATLAVDPSTPVRVDTTVGMDRRLSS